MTGSQIESLRDAFCSAFDQDALDQMLRLRLDKDRTQLAGSGGLRMVVFKVIEVAVREGWHVELIRAAISYNPGNTELRRFCAEHPELLVNEENSMADVTLVPKEPRREAKRLAEESMTFKEDRQTKYKEMWERVERLNVEGRLQEILAEEFSRRIAEINAFLLISNVYIDDADRKLVNSYARAARAFHEAVRSSGDAAAKLALGDTAEISDEVIRKANAIGEAQAVALAFRAALLDKVRAVVSGQSE